MYAVYAYSPLHPRALINDMFFSYESARNFAVSFSQTSRKYMYDDFDVVNQTTGKHYTVVKRHRATDKKAYISPY